MNPFSYVKSIYALDTIDTRFTISSSTPYRATADSQIDPTASTSKKHDVVPAIGVRTDHRGKPIAQPSKWTTTEFYIYYVVFVIVVPYMFWIVYDVSRPSNTNYHKYEHLLDSGWIPGRKIDLSDAQYSTFRGNLGYLAILLFVQPVARNLYLKFRGLPAQNEFFKPRGSSKASAVSGDARLEQRASFDFGFAFVFLGALHGFSAFKVLTLLYMNYGIATRLPRKYVPVATWVFNISTLFANELSEGYRFSKIAAFISPIPDLDSSSFVHGWAEWLDSYGGIMSRWEVLFNITVLRMISFNLDYYWSLDKRGGSPIEKKQLDPANLSERDRVSIPASARDYSFRNFVAYAVYAPLYLTGPIITFNDYIAQNKYRTSSIETSRTIKYGMRLLLCLLSMELILHFDYCIAIAKANPDWTQYSPAQLSLLSYFSLHILWLKLLLPWRFFRLWSLIDGIDPPENMLRCPSNCPSTVQFWRGWHRSFNRWLIRYIYLPLGGASSKTWMSTLRSVINYVAVFTFVALWHDISLNLLVWGWLVVFFMMPEVLAGVLFPKKKWENSVTAYRVLCGIGGVGNLFLMVAANLVGFAVGLDGLKSILYGIFFEYTGILFLITACLSLFVGVQIMFEVRESEMRKGIFLKC